jgi:hypothetical protein
MQEHAGRHHAVGTVLTVGLLVGFGLRRVLRSE